ncbi:MAG: J domain-containing protein [Bacteroidia bacterium]
MQSNDLYAILGISSSASKEEIKAAFRKLAKLHHPDKNPDSKDSAEKFRQIKEAYETLINPLRRQKYDSKQRYSSTYKSRTAAPADKKTKVYTTTEEDIRRRKYYQQNYGTQKKQRTNTAPPVSRYNETKYILFTIPIAVALLFLIINLYNDEKPAVVTEQTATELPKQGENRAQDTVKRLAGTSDSPYTSWFGSAKVDRRSGSVINVYNRSGYDAVVCLTDKSTGKTVRHYFIADDYYLLFEFIPEGDYYFKSYLGTGFNFSKKLLHDSIQGAFDQAKQFQKNSSDKLTIALSGTDTFSVYIKTEERKNRISAEEFFRRPK